MLLAVAAACAGETVEVPGETVVVEKVVTETVEVPGETVVVEKEVIRTVEVPGETVTKEVVKEVMVPGETVVVKEEVVKTVEVPGETVTVEVVKTVEVPGETVVVEKEVVKTVEVPGQTVVVEKVVVQEVPGKKYVTDPTTGKAVSAPQYGGTITYVVKSLAQHPFDSYLSTNSVGFVGGVVEKLGIKDWALNRDKYPFGGYMTPLYALRGALAESWDISPDGLTYTFHIRKGVKWHDKAPMNGRELTADDVVYNFHRYTATGSGFTEPSPVAGELGKVQFESITATDKYTVDFKLKQPYLRAVNVIMDWQNVLMYAPEVIKEHGDANDWKNLVGTGPFMLTDYAEGNFFAYSKNPDYWGYDEKYPENRLPYIDELRRQIMPDEATFMAALRTGKVDYIGSAGSTQLRVIDVVESLKRTNPELMVYSYSIGNVINSLNVSKPPFDDIRVRRAVQMALDLETINNTYFKGYGDTTPKGITGMPEYYIPFEEWPQEVKKAYTYDPEGAEKLLDEAGYKRSSDGIRFKFVHRFLDRLDPDLAVLVASYWREIGVDMKIEMIDIAQHMAAFVSKDFDMIINRVAVQGDPMQVLSSYTTGGFANPIALSDPVYDALYEKAAAASTFEEQKPLVTEMDIYAIKRHWFIWTPEAPLFNVIQPWVKGYNGEAALGGSMPIPVFARLWIDSELKEAMGR